MTVFFARCRLEYARCRLAYALFRRWIARQYLEFLLWRLDRTE